MLHLITRNSLGALVSLLTVFCARAGVIQSTPTLPPVEGIYSLHATACLLAACIVESNIGNLVPTSSDIVGGNQLVTADATATAAVFQNVGGMPGAPIGSINLLGTLSITYVGRSSEEQLGTFPTLLTAFDFSGTFNGHTLHSRLNSTQGGNSGITTVTDVSVPMIHQFMVESFFDVFAELSLDGGPFIPQPERHLTLEAAVPEAGTAGLALISISGIAAAAWMKRRGIASPRA